MVAVEHVYLVRILNISPQELNSNEQVESVMKDYSKMTKEMIADVSQYIFDKYCNEDRDRISFEQLKLEPLDRQGLIDTI